MATPFEKLVRDRPGVVTPIQTFTVARLRFASSFDCVSHPGLHATFLKNLLVGKSDDICYIIPGFPIVITPYG